MKIILSDGEVKEMTFEEVLEKFMPLINSLAYKYTYVNREYEDMKQIASLEAWRAFTKYDYRKGVKFITYLYPWVLRSLKNVVRGEFARKRIPRENLISQEIKIGENIQLKDSFKEDSFEDDIVCTLDYKRLEDNFNSRDKKIISMRVQGYTQEDIAKSIGLSQRCISRDLKMIRKTIENELYGGTYV